VTALEYAERLKPLATELHKSLFVIMRAYVEKPVLPKIALGLTYRKHSSGKV